MSMYKQKKTLTDSLLVNPDFELTDATHVNHGGIEKKGYKPYGWSIQGTLNGSSYGINHDAANHYGENVLWFNTRPFPLDFQLYQTIPASKLTPGNYRVRCLLWCQTGAFGTCRLFANNNVQYFGKESDYNLNLTEGDRLQVFLSHAEGTVDVTVGMEGQEPIYRGNGQQNADFVLEIAETGNYHIFVFGHQAKGNISFTRIPEKTE